MPKTPKPVRPLPEWEQVLSSVCRLQEVLPGAVLVGGSAAAAHVGHRLSSDHDHVLTDLSQQLESVAGWQTARVSRPVMVLGSLDGIETGVRQLRRSAPLETETLEFRGVLFTLPTKAETLRIKAYLMLDRNATRDYLDFVALADVIGSNAVSTALEHMDELYPQANRRQWAVRSQIVRQLSDPRPYDLDEVDLKEYIEIRPPYDRWDYVAKRCGDIAVEFGGSLMQHLTKEAQAEGPAPAEAREAAQDLSEWTRRIEEGEHPEYPKLPGLKRS